MKYITPQTKMMIINLCIVIFVIACIRFIGWAFVGGMALGAVFGGFTTIQMIFNNKHFGVVRRMIIKKEKGDECKK